MNHFKVYYIFIKANLKSQMEYRLDFLLLTFANIVYYSIGLLSIWVILNRFHTIGDWNFAQVAFLYSLALLSYALFGLFFYHSIRFSTLVVRGEFDRFLVRPWGLLLQLMGKNFNLFFVAHSILSITILVITSRLAGIEWNIVRLLFLIPVVGGGFLILFSFGLVAATISFWTLESSSFYQLFIYNAREFIWYPISIYSKAIQILLTFVIPFAFINFFPAQYFLEKNDFTIFPPVFQFLTPVVGIILFIISYKFWQFGVNHYQSTGS